jgi:hypothetical protein
MFSSNLTKLDKEVLVIKKLFSNIFILFVLCIFLFPTNTLAGQTTLTWDPPDISTNVTGYMLHYGTASGSYLQAIDVGNARSYTVSNLADGQTYYFAVTAYNAAHYESVYSNEVSNGITLQQYLLTISNPNPDWGTVLGSGINCGATCLATRNAGTVVSLSATAASGSIFNGWSGGGCSGTGLCTVTMKANVTITASFIKTPTQPTTPVNIDFNGDGKSDILLRRASDGRVDMWMINGTSMASSTTLYTDIAWTVVGTGDFNGDGKSDILLRRASDGRVDIWLMNGASKASSATLYTDIAWTVVGTGDFNGDGKSDILLRRASDGRVDIWLMNGASLASSATLYTDIAWTVVETGDFNGDGKSDILWRRAADGYVVMWLMNGASLASSATLYIDPAVTVVGTGDFNGDGKSDILWRRAADGNVVIWLMNGASMASGATLYGDLVWQPVGLQ